MDRVLQVVGTMDRGGAETMLMNLFRVIDRQQVVFDFLCFGDDVYDYQEDIEQLGGRILRLVVGWDFLKLRRMFAIYLLLKRGDYKVVHSHMLFASAYVLLASWLAGVPVRIAHAHNTSDKAGQGIFRRVYHVIARKLLLSSATKLVACGRLAAEFTFGTTSREVELISNAVDVRGFIQARRSRGVMRQVLKVPDSVPLIVQVGTINSTKNQQYLIEIAREFKEAGVPAKFLIVGRGEATSEKNCAVAIDSYHLSDTVEMIGVRDDVQQILAAADVLVMPSLHEGFPVILVEAQAAGLPSVVSSNVSREVDLGVELVFFQELDCGPKEWMYAIIDVLEREGAPDDLRYQRLSHSGFDVYVSAGRIINLYR